MRTHRLLCIGWLLLGWEGWDGWTGWCVGGTGVGRTVVSACRNGNVRIGAPPLDLEGLQCAGWLLPTWDRWTGWGVGGTGVGWTNVSTRRNGSATMGAGAGKPPLALEGLARYVKWWLAPILFVLQGRGVFVSEKQNNTNRVHTNPNL